MTIKSRLEGIDAQLLVLENLSPIVLSQEVNPTQKDWEIAWVAAGNTLPISPSQEFFWHDIDYLRGQFSSLNERFYPLLHQHYFDRFLLFEVLDFAGWEDDTHYFLYINTPDETVAKGAVRGYLDGSFEQLAFTGFNPDRLLGYDRANDYLWYLEGTVVKYILTATEAITIVVDLNLTSPSSIHFVIVADGSGDAYFGGEKTGDSGSGLYFWDESLSTATQVLFQFTIPAGTFDADKPLAATATYVYLRADAAQIVQFRRSDYAGLIVIEDSVLGMPAISVTHNLIVLDTDHSNDSLILAYVHVAAGALLSEWQITITWDGTGATTTVGLLYQRIFDTLKNVEQSRYGDKFYNAPRHHATTNIYFTEDHPAPGNAQQFHSFSQFHYNPSKTLAWLQDREFFNIVSENELEVWIFSFSDTGASGKVWRVSEWSMDSEDMLILDETPIAGQGTLTVPMTRPAGYNLLEILLDLDKNATSSVSISPVFESGNDDDMNVRFYIGSTQIAFDNDAYVGGLNILGSAIITARHILRILVFLSDTDSDELHPVLFVQSYAFVSGGGDIHTHSAGMKMMKSSVANDVLSHLTISGSSQRWANDARLVRRAYRTELRNPIKGTGYDPAMA